MGGYSYMEFVVPGLIMMAIVTNSYANVVASFFGAKFNNSVEELLVRPFPPTYLPGYAGRGESRRLGGDYRDYCFAVFYKVAYPQSNAGGAGRYPHLGVVFAARFYQCGVRQHLRRYQYCPRVCADTPDYPEGFYSLDLLPDFWASVSQINPLVYVVSAFRFGMLGVSDVNLAFALSMIVVCVVQPSATACTCCTPANACVPDIMVAALGSRASLLRSTVPTSLSPSSATPQPKLEARSTGRYGYDRWHLYELSWLDRHMPRLCWCSVY